MQLDMSVMMLHDNLSLYCHLVLCDQSLRHLQTLAQWVSDKKGLCHWTILMYVEVFSDIIMDTGLFTFMPETQDARKKAEQTKMVNLTEIMMESISYWDSIIATSSIKAVVPERCDDDDEENYHCWFCKNSAVNGNASMFCYVEKVRKRQIYACIRVTTTQPWTNRKKSETKLAEVKMLFRSSTIFTQ